MFPGTEYSLKSQYYPPIVKWRLDIVQMWNISNNKQTTAQLRDYSVLIS